MKKNVSGQFVSVQMVNSTDGSAVTSGTTTCYVMGDGGSQTVGSVGSGACTHKGNGLWTYAPAQAETNYNQIAYTFVNSTAINSTVLTDTTFPQTGDNFTVLGTPAGASVSADIAAVKSELGTPAGASISADIASIKTELGTPAGASVSADIASIQADTTNIKTRIPAALVGGRMDGNVGAIASDTASPTNLQRAVLGTAIATVGSASTTTSIVTSSITPAAAVTDQFKGRIVVFDKNTTTTNLRGQATDITGSSSGGVLTVTALTTAPVSGDTFTIQ